MYRNYTHRIHVQYGIFTYIWLTFMDFYGKSTSIYHTWILWDMGNHPYLSLSPIKSSLMTSQSQVEAAPEPLPLKLGDVARLEGVRGWVEGTDETSVGCGLFLHFLRGTSILEHC